MVGVVGKHKCGIVEGEAVNLEEVSRVSEEMVLLE